MRSVRIAREPILDRRNTLLGFALRFAPGSARPDAAGADEVAMFEGLLAAEGEQVLTRRRAGFVRVSAQALREQAYRRLPAQLAVLEVPGDLQVDSTIRSACADARRQGFKIAIDDFAVTSPAADLVGDADFLKVDVTNPRRAEERARTVACFRPNGKTLIAKGIKTATQVEIAAQEGFNYLQGYFICEPALRTAAPATAPLQITLLRLLSAMNDPNLSNGALEDLVKHDAALCHHILRSVNSAAMARRMPVSSMQEALLLLGRNTVRRWASLWIVAGFGAAAHEELITMATARARMCELLAVTAGASDGGGEAFLLGLCSLLDVMSGRLLSEIVRDLPLADHTKQALLGERVPGRDLLDCVVFYERGAWADCEAAGRRARVNTLVLPDAHLEALRWAREFQNATAGAALAR